MSKAPWQQPPLDMWAICGMNHYHVAGEKFLFVSMVKDGKCITEEGKDDKYLWNRLCHKAWASDEKVLINLSAVKWLHGEHVDGFEPPANQKLFRGKLPQYWWRSEFRRRCGLE